MREGSEVDRYSYCGLDFEEFYIVSWLFFYYLKHTFCVVIGDDRGGCRGGDRQHHSALQRVDPGSRPVDLSGEAKPLSNNSTKNIT